MLPPFAFPLVSLAAAPAVIVTSPPAAAPAVSVEATAGEAVMLTLLPVCDAPVVATFVGTVTVVDVGANVATVCGVPAVVPETPVDGATAMRRLPLPPVPVPMPGVSVAEAPATLVSVPARESDASVCV
jgi:hypothetical protein